MDITNQIQDILSKAGNAINGHDADDNDITYDSIALWKSTVLFSTDDESNNHTTNITNTNSKADTQTILPSDELKKKQWYQTGHDYYEDESNCPATVDGVLGGFAHLSARDLKASRVFLEKLQEVRVGFRMNKCDDGDDTYALECGAGIGRVSRGLLFPLGFTICDLVEPSQRLLSHAPDYIGKEYAHRCRYFCTGLQDFTPQPNKYTIIFIQWVIGYLTDEDLVAFLKRCAVGLRRGGVIVIKDNTCQDVAFVADREDASVTRSLPYILAIVRLSGLKVVMEKYQDDFPDDIFPVPMLALGRCDD